MRHDSRHTHLAPMFLLLLQPLSPSPRHLPPLNTIHLSLSLSLLLSYIFLLPAPPKRSIPRSFPSPFLRRILSNPFLHTRLFPPSLPSPPLIGTKMKKGARVFARLRPARSVPFSPNPPLLSTRHEGGGSRARREIITRRKGTFSTDTTHTPTCNARYYVPRNAF